jgi:hypothetical protein
MSMPCSVKNLPFFLGIWSLNCFMLTWSAYFHLTVFLSLEFDFRAHLAVHGIFEGASFILVATRRLSVLSPASE